MLIIPTSYFVKLTIEMKLNTAISGVYTMNTVYIEILKAEHQ